MIKDLGELKKLMALCRKQGVAKITLEGGMAIEFGALPSEQSGKSDEQDKDDGEGTYVPGIGMIPPGMTPEAFVFMSSPSPQPSEPQ